MNTDEAKKQLEENLPYFTGTESYTNLRYPWLRSRFLLTDGTKYLAETAQAFWLMDAIASHQANRKVASEPFQVWRLFVDLGDGKSHEINANDFPKIAALVREWETRLTAAQARKALPLFSVGKAMTPAVNGETPKALIICDDGKGNILCHQEVPYTDFPLAEITLYAEQSDYLGGRVVMLTSEY